MLIGFRYLARSDYKAGSPALSRERGKKKEGEYRPKKKKGNSESRKSEIVIF